MPAPHPARSSAASRALPSRRRKKTRCIRRPSRLPDRFAFSASYHQVPGAPEASSAACVAGRENMVPIGEPFAGLIPHRAPSSGPARSTRSRARQATFSSWRDLALRDLVDQRIDGRIGDPGDVARARALRGLRSRTRCRRLSPGVGRRRAPSARHVEIEIVHAALVLGRIDDARAGLDAEPLQVRLERLRVRLQRCLEVEELDLERLAVRQLEDAALALAAGLAQELVGAAQEACGPGRSRRRPAARTGSPKTSSGTLPRNGSSSASSSGEGLPTAFMSRVLEDRRSVRL